MWACCGGWRIRIVLGGSDMAGISGVRRTIGVGVASLIVLCLLILSWSIWMGTGRDAVQDNVTLRPAGTAPDDLERASEVRIFFGHQSIGANILSGIDDLYAEAGIQKLNVVESTHSIDESGASLQHALIGSNGDPDGKIRAFGEILDAGTAKTIDVAMMKLCYLDFTSETDVDALFRSYTEALDALEAKYPNVRFLHATAPLTVESGIVDTLKSTAKAWLRGRLYSPPENQVRERYNTLIRARYGDTGRLLDIAAWEALRPDGTLTAKASGAGTYLSLNPDNASDGAHLNDQGAKKLAAAFLHLIATQEQ